MNEQDVPHPAPPPAAAAGARGPLLALAPVLVALGIAAGLAIASLSSQASRQSLLTTAAIVTALAGLLAVVLLYRQARLRQAALHDLRNAEARATGLAESAMDPIISVDAQQRIVLFNAAAERVFGWPREAVIGQPLDKLIPERLRALHRGHVEGFARTGATSRMMGPQSVLWALRASGEEFPIEASISQHVEDGTPRLTAIVRDVTARVRAMEDLRRSKEELQELGAAAHATREQEKSRIARELHDELGQSLTMLQMDLAWFKANTPEATPDYAAKLERMEKLLKGTVAATRRIASDLRPLMLDDLGLVPALEWLVQNMRQRTGIDCAFTIDSPSLTLPSTHSTAVFRIVQEALTNIAKHARAATASVTVRREGPLLRIVVEDDGLGFAVDDPRKPTAFGLLGLRERTSLLRGKATIASAPGEGTRIDIELPVEGEAGAS